MSVVAVAGALAAVPVACSGGGSPEHVSHLAAAAAKRAVWAETPIEGVEVDDYYATLPRFDGPCAAVRVRRYNESWDHAVTVFLLRSEDGYAPLDITTFSLDDLDGNNPKCRRARGPGS